MVGVLTTSCNVARPQGLVALCADEVETGKVVALAERILSIGVLDGEELLCNDLVAVLARNGQCAFMRCRGWGGAVWTYPAAETIQVVDLVQCANKLAAHSEAALCAVRDGPRTFCGRGRRSGRRG